MEVPKIIGKPLTCPAKSYIQIEQKMQDACLCSVFINGHQTRIFTSKSLVKSNTNVQISQIVQEDDQNDRPAI